MYSLYRINTFERRRNYSEKKVPSSSKYVPIKRMKAQEYEKTIQELLEKIEMLESKLVETGMDKINIVTSHQKLTAENSILKREVKSSEKRNKELNIKNYNTSQKIDSINKYFKDIKSSYENKFELMLRELRQKSEDINDLIDKMKEKDNKILDMKISNNLTYKEIEKKMNELEMLKLTNKTQEEKINLLQKELDKLYLEKRCEGNLLMENKHLKDDNIKLVELLSITE
jgi:chromosome segregation ATPase